MLRVVRLRKKCDARFAEKHHAMIAGEHRLALPAGYQLGKYRLTEVLGAGGFGITYLAEDSSLSRRVAIKELLPNDIATRLDGSTVVAKTKGEEQNLEWARDRFVKEGRALAACDHPNVVNVFEMIEANGTAYMVTKFEEGRSLSAWLKEVGGAPTERELRSILMPLLSGLEKVHRAGFLHRDLKPENIYITDDGRPILLDFGSARQAVSDRTTSLTSIVTSGYAPFEQYHEDGKQGAWTDIYAMAAVLYRAIHGAKPPEATRRLKDDPCVRLAKEHGGKYSEDFLEAIDRALAVEADDRPQSVAEWRTMLGVEPAERAAPPWWETWLARAAALAQTRPQLAAGVALGVVALSVGVWKISRPTPKPEPVPILSEKPATPAPAPVSIATPVPEPAPVAVATPAPKPVIATPPPAPPVAVEPPPSTPPAAVKSGLVWDGFRNAYGNATPPPAPPVRALGPQRGQKWTNSLGMTFAPVPGMDAHMGVREMRRMDFEAFVRATGYNAIAGALSLTPKGWRAMGASWVSPGFPQTPEHPVVAVSAYDAVAFCRWLTEKERSEGRIDASMAYRLPTDVEWSSAAGGKPFPWGDAWPPTVGAGDYAGEESRSLVGRTLAGYRDGYAGTAPAGTFQANAAGFYDMGGNALEWVGLWFRKELNAPEIREKVPGLDDDGGGQRFLVLRGGSWAYFAKEMMLTATHDFGPPEARFVTTGFRCVLAPAGAQAAFVLPPLAAPTVEVPAASDSDAPVDRRLVGIWETKATGPAGMATFRWEQDADGRYRVAINGTPSDAGRLSADDGRLRQTSDASGVTTDVTYQFKTATQLVTTGPLGQATWRKLRVAATRPREDEPPAAEDRNDQPADRSNDEPRPKTKQQVPADIRREIQKRVPFRLPF